MRSEGNTLAAVTEYLRSQGVRCCPSSISKWLKDDARAACRRVWEDRVITALKDNNDRLNSVLKTSGESGMAAVMVGLEKVALQVSVYLSAEQTEARFDGADLAEVREQLELIAQSIKPILDYRKVVLAEQAGKRDERRLQDEMCKRFLEWYSDQRAREIADSTAPNEEKVRRMRSEFFADVEALEKAGGVVLPPV
jgi:virulence-associated protein VapD